MREIITLIIAILSFIISFILFCFNFAFNCKKITKDNKEEGSKQAIINNKLENLIVITNTMSTQISLLMDKVDNQNNRITKLEEAVRIANLTDIPSKLAELESSVKSAHHRIDELRHK